MQAEEIRTLLFAVNAFHSSSILSSEKKRSACSTWVHASNFTVSQCQRKIWKRNWIKKNFVLKIVLTLTFKHTHILTHLHSFNDKIYIQGRTNSLSLLRLSMGRKSFVCTFWILFCILIMALTEWHVRAQFQG